MDASDQEFMDNLQDLVDAALDAVYQTILDLRQDVMSYDANGIPLGLTKSNTISIQDVHSAIELFKIQNRI